jgi:hypothetical protein
MRTPCGRFIGSRTYSLSWAPTFRGRLALPCCVLIISQTLRFVKTFFEKTQFYFLGFRLHPLLSGSVLLAKSLVEELGNTPWNRTFVETSFRTPLYTFIVSQLGWFVKGFFTFFSSLRCGFRSLRPLPLTPIVYHRPHQKSSTFFKNF